MNEHWLDRIIRQQEEANGPAITKLIQDAAKVEEVVDVDELERHARDQREQGV